MRKSTEELHLTLASAEQFLAPQLNLLNSERPSDWDAMSSSDRNGYYMKQLQIYRDSVYNQSIGPQDQSLIQKLRDKIGLEESNNQLPRLVELFDRIRDAIEGGEDFTMFRLDTFVDGVFRGDTNVTLTGRTLFTMLGIDEEEYGNRRKMIIKQRSDGNAEATKKVSFRLETDIPGLTFVERCEFAEGENNIYANTWSSRLFYAA